MAGTCPWSTVLVTTYTSLTGFSFSNVFVASSSSISANIASVSPYSPVFFFVCDTLTSGL